MLPFEEIVRRLTALEGQVRQMLRLGYVVEVLPEEARVRVECRDADCLQTYTLPVLAPKTRCDKGYWLPDLGEQVLCVFLPLGLEVGFVLGALYSLADVVPVASPDKAHLRWQDGAWVEYDRGSGEMQVHCRGSLTLAAEEIVLKAGSVKMPDPIITEPGEPELKPVEPSPLPEPEEWPYG